MEPLKATKPCPDRSRTVYNPALGKALPVLCDRWSCRQCGGRKRDKLARRGAALHADGMLTTTISDAWSDGLDAASPEALAYLQERDRVFRRHVERAFGKAAYLWVVEAGEAAGRWHRHYLWRWREPIRGGRRGWLPRWMLSRLQDFARSAGLGRMDWQPLDDDRAAARYVSKYVAKAAGDGEGLKLAPARGPECICHPDLEECLCGAPGSHPARRFRRFASNEPYSEPREPGWRYANRPVVWVERFLMCKPEGPPSMFLTLAGSAPPS